MLWNPPEPMGLTQRYPYSVPVSLHSEAALHNQNTKSLLPTLLQQALPEIKVAVQTGACHGTGE